MRWRRPATLGREIPRVRGPLSSAAPTALLSTGPLSTASLSTASLMSSRAKREAVPGNLGNCRSISSSKECATSKRTLRWEIGFCWNGLSSAEIFQFAGRTGTTSMSSGSSTHRVMKHRSTGRRPCRFDFMSGQGTEKRLGLTWFASRLPANNRSATLLARTDCLAVTRLSRLPRCSRCQGAVPGVFVKRPTAFSRWRHGCGSQFAPVRMACQGSISP